MQAVAKVECDTQQRRHSQQLQWEAKQQEMDQKLEAAEAGKLADWLGPRVRFGLAIVVDGDKLPVD